MNTKNADDEAGTDSNEDASTPSTDLDVEEQPFNVNGPADATSDQEQRSAESQDPDLPGRGLDVEEQPFNVNGPSDPEAEAEA